VGDDAQPRTWREKLGQLAIRALERFESAMKSPAHCGRCGKEYPLGELLRSHGSIPSERPSDIQVPFLCCPECAAVLRGEIAKYFGLVERDRRLAREDLVVWRQNERAREAGAVGSLTLNQWIYILNAFRWRCAYCPDGPYQALEHVIPISRGGGTTAYNCVPACTPCNSAKGGRHPDEIRETSRSPEAIRRVRAQLQQLQDGMPE